VAALEAAIALKQMAGVAVVIGDHLHFDVAGLVNELLDVHFGVRRRVRPRTGGHEALHQADVVAGDAHPLAAAARHRLDQHRIADLLGDLEGFFLAILTMPSLPGAMGTPALRIVSRATDLSPILRMLSGVGSDEGDVAVLADFREMRVFSEEPIPGMDRIHIRHLGGADDVGDLEVAVLRRRAGRCRWPRRPSARAWTGSAVE
jgi:hypothetical protein